MLSKVNTVCFNGIKGIQVSIEIHISTHLPSFNIVGLPDKTINECKERIKCCFENIGLALPPRKIVINLLPANIQKEGSHYDLPIAIGLLACLGIIPAKSIENFIIIGEISLDGSINAVKGTCICAIHAVKNNMGIICPYDNAKEAAWTGCKNIITPKNIIEIIEHCKNEKQKISLQNDLIFKKEEFPFDMSDVKGQESAKRACMICAMGKHNLLMIGPPGSGKSMLAKRLLTILPEISFEEILQSTCIHTLTNTLGENKIITQRPFRSPHTSISLQAMIGGGCYAEPGEISLAHNGILFMDELPEFKKNILESLRQPLEDKIVNICRVKNKVTYPCNFHFIAAMNECSCSKGCPVHSKCSIKYQNKISKAIRDRIDMTVYVDKLPFKDLCNQKEEISSKNIKEILAKGMKMQIERNKQVSKKFNFELSDKELLKISPISSKIRDYLNLAVEKMNISPRSYYKIIRVARSIADIECCKHIEEKHIMESLSYNNFLDIKKY